MDKYHNVIILQYFQQCYHMIKVGCTVYESLFSHYLYIINIHPQLRS